MKITKVKLKESRRPAMEDRYLFKAKKIDNGEWVQGYLYGIWEKRYILWGMTNDTPNMIEVDPSTICQCTGMKDKNGKLIWENDIIGYQATYIIGTGVAERDYIGKVIWDHETSSFQIAGELPAESYEGYKMLDDMFRIERTKDEQKTT